MKRYLNLKLPIVILLLVRYSQLALCVDNVDPQNESPIHAGFIFSLFSLEPVPPEMVAIINEIYDKSNMENTTQRVDAGSDEMLSYGFFKPYTFFIYLPYPDGHYRLAHIINPGKEAMFAVTKEQESSEKIIPDDGFLDIVPLSLHYRRKIQPFIPGEDNLLPYSLSNDVRKYTPSSPLLFTTFKKRTDEQVQFSQAKPLSLGGIVIEKKRKLKPLTISEAEEVKRIMRQYPIKMVSIPLQLMDPKLLDVKIFLPNEKGNFLISFYANTNIDNIIIYEIGSMEQSNKTITDLAENDRILLKKLLLGE